MEVKIEKEASKLLRKLLNYKIKEEDIFEHIMNEISDKCLPDNVDYNDNYNFKDNIGITNEYYNLYFTTISRVKVSLVAELRIVYNNDIKDIVGLKFYKKKGGL